MSGTPIAVIKSLMVAYNNVFMSSDCTYSWSWKTSKNNRIGMEAFAARIFS